MSKQLYNQIWDPKSNSTYQALNNFWSKINTLYSLYKFLNVPQVKYLYFKATKLDWRDFHYFFP